METNENKDLVYEFGKFALNPKERTLLVDGEAVHLPAKEFDTLLLLVEHNGRALSKEEMLSAIWHDAYVEESNLAKQISRLRKLLSSKGDQFIETLPKHGYRFSADLRRTLIETQDAVILEKRTVKRVTFALENETEPGPLGLPPARRTFPAIRILALILTAVVLVYLGWHYRHAIFPSTAAAIDPYAPIRLTDNPNDDTWASWTPDGRIRFTRVHPDNRSELLIMNADGTAESVISMSDEKWFPLPSPDNRKVMFRKKSDQKKLYLSNTDGSGEIVLPFSGGTWSPDSKTILYHSKLGQDHYDIFAYSVETGQSRNITNNNSFNVDPSMSPDGKLIVFVSNRDANLDIYSINVDGSNLKRLTFNNANENHPSFSPDGTQILFNSNRENENEDVYVMNLDGSNPQKITNWDKTTETAEPGCWSPDGTKIAFWSNRNGKDDIYVVSAETVRPRLVLSDPGYDLHYASYSPDGKRILYTIETENKSGELRIFDLQTRQSNLICKTDLPVVTADWSHDGNWIVFFDRISGNSEIFRVRPDGTQLQRLTNDPAIDAGPAWSPDGTRIVFGRGALSGAVQLHIMNADGSNDHPLTTRLGWEGDARWFGDGNRILFGCDRTDSPGNMLDICQINADGSGERRLLFHRDHDVQPDISPDGKVIAFASHADGNDEIYLMNSDGSGLRRLTRNPADDFQPRWSPDGKKLVFMSNRTGKTAMYEIAFP